MTIGTINRGQFNLMSSLINVRAEELVNNMVIVDIAGANKVRSGANSANYANKAVGGNFSASA